MIGDGVAASRAAPTDGAAAVSLAYEAYSGRLACVARRVGSPPDRVDDLVQESFLRLWREVQAGREPAVVWPWLVRVCTNLVHSDGRRRAVVGRWAVLRHADDHEPDPALIVLARETGSALDRALASLGADAGVGLAMVAAGWRNADVASAIGRSPAATRTLLCRSRRRMREALQAAS